MQKENTQIVLLDWRVQTNLGRYRWNVSDILHLWHFFAYNQLNFQERNVFFCANKMHKGQAPCSNVAQYLHKSYISVAFCRTSG